MKRILTLPFIVVGLLASAQQVDMDLFKGMKMRHIGPGTMSGRVTCIDVVNEEPNVIFVGTASGGLWKSESAGMDWEPIFDDQPVQSIGAIAIDQNNPDVIWAGTGEETLETPTRAVQGFSAVWMVAIPGSTWGSRRLS